MSTLVSQEDVLWKLELSRLRELGATPAEIRGVFRRVALKEIARLDAKLREINDAAFAKEQDAFGAIDGVTP